jgi:hypothetical protein
MRGKLIVLLGLVVVFTAPGIAGIRNRESENSAAIERNPNSETMRVEGEQRPTQVPSTHDDDHYPSYARASDHHG